MKSDKLSELNVRQMRTAAPRAARVLRLRDAGETWEAIGKLLGVSRQRAQALAAQARRHREVIGP